MEKKNQNAPVRMPPRRVDPPRMFPVLNPDKIMAIIETQCGDVHIAKRYGEGANKVFILPEAYEEFCGIVISLWMSGEEPRLSSPILFRFRR